MLKRTRKSYFDIVEIETETVIVEAMGRCMRAIGEFAVEHKGCALPLHCNRSQGKTGLGIARTDYYRRLRLDDAALFRRDRRNRIAEILHVIEADRSDDAQKRMHYVGGIEAPAESGLDDGDIDIFIRAFLLSRRQAA